MTKKTSRPARRHHTVPKAYLKRFAKEKSLLTVELPGSRSYLQSVDDASVRKQFHTIEGHPEGEDYGERLFSGVESKFFQHLGRIETGVWPLFGASRQEVAQFIALQATRTPGARHGLDRVAGNVMREILLKRGPESFFENMPEGVVEPERLWEEVVSGGNLQVVQNNASHLIQALKYADLIVPHLLLRPWMLISFDIPGLVTSDTPVALFRESGSRGGGTGFQNASAVLFPLSRHQALLMQPQIGEKDGQERWGITIHGGKDSTVAGNHVLLRELNEVSVGGALRYLHLHPDDKDLLPIRLPEPRDDFWSIGRHI